MEIDKNLLIFGALGLGAYFYMNSNKPKERMFNVNGQAVPESQLPALGYVNVAGQWYTQAQIAAAASAGGVNPPTSGTDPAWNTIATVLATAAQIVPLVVNIANATGGSGGGSGAGNGSAAGSSSPS